jgi:hypothetical protein
MNADTASDDVGKEEKNEMSTDTIPDDVRAESEISYPVRTLRRLVLIVINPLKATKYIAHDPDLLIIPLMFIIFAIFALLQPVVLMSKIVIPDQVALYSPDNETINAFHRPFIRVSELKTEALKLYWGGTLTYYALLVVITFSLLYIAARIILGPVGYKLMLSGVTYSSMALVIVGVVWLGISFLNPGVVIPYSTKGNLTYIPWVAATADLSQIKSVAVLTNFTVSDDPSATELWTLYLSTVLVQSGTTVVIDASSMTGSVQEGALTVTLPNSTRASLQPGMSLPISPSRIEFRLQGGKLYLVRFDGSLLEIQSSATLKFELHMQLDPYRSDICAVNSSTAGSGVLLSKPRDIVLTSNASAITSITSNATFSYWRVLARVGDDGSVELFSNLTIAHTAKADSSTLAWQADSVVAQASTLMMYYNYGVASQPSPIVDTILQLVLPALSKAWEAVILVCLVKASYEDASWFRAALAVAAQQIIMVVLGF